MRATKRTLLAAVFLALSYLTSTAFARQTAPPCSLNIPRETFLRLYPDEHSVAGTTSGPVLFTLAADVRFFVNRPPILPRGSKITGKMESSSEAGRLWDALKPILCSVPFSCPTSASIQSMQH